MGLLSRLGLARSTEVSALRSQVAALETTAFNDRVKRGQAASGVPITFGQFEYEHNIALRGNGKWPIYDKMEADPHVKGNLNGKILPLLSAEWEIEPATDSARDADIAEFVSANLLRSGGDTYGEDYYSQTSWSAQRLPEILDMVRSGFAMFSKSTKVVNGMRVYDRLQWLEPASVDPLGWRLGDDDSIQSVLRTYKTPSADFRVREPLDVAALALYVWELKGARFEGRAGMRSAYGPWFRKEFIQKQAMMWAQKAGSPLPYLNVPQATIAEDYQKIVEFAEALRGTDPDVGFLVLRKAADGTGLDVNFAGAEFGEVDRMRGLIDGENSEIAKVGGSQMGQLAEAKTGSRALAEPIGRLEMLYVQSIANVVCQWETHGVANLEGNIAELVHWNFGPDENGKATKLPKLKCAKVNPAEGLDTMPGFLEGVKAGLVPKTPEVAKLFCDRYGFELPDSVYAIVGQAPALPVVAPGQPGQDGQQGAAPSGQQPASGAAQDGNPEDAALAMSMTRDRIAAMLLPAEGGAPIGAGFRAPNILESRYCNLGATLETFRVGERDIMTELRAMREAMVKDLMRRLRAGQITRDNIEQQRRSKFRETAKFTDRLLAVLRGVGAKGRDQAKAELEKQMGRSMARVA